MKLDNLEDSMDDAISALKTNGRSKNINDVNILDMFFTKYGKHPSLLGYDNNNFEYFKWVELMDNLKNLYPGMKILFKEEIISIKYDKKYTKRLIIELRDGLMFDMYGAIGDDIYSDEYSIDGDDVIVTGTYFLTTDDVPPSEEDKLTEAFKNTFITKNDAVCIGIISNNDGRVFVRDFDIKDNITDLKELDLHYGDGFKEFDEKLFTRLLNSNKGLTLFHGEPGSGKTTYLRHLIKKIKLENKKNNVLYFPPTMIGSITDPSFISFLSDWVSNSDGKNYLLIEDAEPLLESRDQSRNIGITNLLNMTDGILNDFLSIQIIATFNTDLSNIDDAILRPERLLARKVFNHLTLENGKKIANMIGVDESLIVDKMVLADIYSLKKESDPIIHGIKENVKLGF